MALPGMAVPVVGVVLSPPRSSLLVIDRSTCGVSVSLSVALSLPVLVSVTPLDAVTVAVFVSVPVADALTVACTV